MFCCEEAKKEIYGKNRITGKYDLPFVFLYSGIARSLSALSPVVESGDSAGAGLEHQVSNFSVVWGLLVFTIASYVPLFRYNRNPANCQYPGRPQHYSHAQESLCWPDEGEYFLFRRRGTKGRGRNLAILCRMLQGIPSSKSRISSVSSKRMQKQKPRSVFLFLIYIYLFLWPHYMLCHQTWKRFCYQFLFFPSVPERPWLSEIIIS